jgi:hypothetical protein
MTFLLGPLSHHHPPSARDDEQVAAALGYLVHMLMLASKYLEVPITLQYIITIITITFITITIITIIICDHT